MEGFFRNCLIFTLFGREVGREMGQLHFDHVSVDRDDADVERGLGVAPLEEAGRLAQDQPDGREEGEEVAAEPERKRRGREN